MGGRPLLIHDCYSRYTPDAVLDTHCYGAVDLYSIQRRFDSYRGISNAFPGTPNPDP